MHYRRLFDFSNVINTSKKDKLTVLGLKRRYLKKIFKKYKFVCTRLFLKKGSPVFLAFEQISTVMVLSPHYHPHLYYGYMKYLKDGILYPKNMFIMSKSDFFDYCAEMVSLVEDLLRKDRNELFEIYFNYRKQHDIKENYEKAYATYKSSEFYYPRFLGHVLEGASSFYFSYMVEKYGQNALCAKLYNTQSSKTVILNPKRRLILRLVIKCLVNKKRYKKFKRDPNKFFKDSKSSVIRFLERHYY